jgi:hypothetical protein
VKLAGDEVTVPQGEAVMVLDFDVAQTFGHVAGASGRWVMHPTIHAVVEEGVEGPAGAIEGAILPGGVEIPACGGTERGLNDFVPTATGTLPVGGPVVATGEPNGEGEYSISPLGPDTYTMGFIPSFTYTDGSALVFTADLPIPVDVIVGDAPETGVTYTLTSAVCVPPTTGG